MNECLIVRQEVQECIDADQSSDQRYECVVAPEPVFEHHLNYTMSRSYNRYVARGWESKSVEEQISDRQIESKKSNKNKLSREQIERQTKREGIVLARSRTVTALETVRDGRYRALLQRTLEHLDQELAKLK